MSVTKITIENYETSEPAETPQPIEIEITDATLCARLSNVICNFWESPGME